VFLKERQLSLLHDYFLLQSESQENEDISVAGSVGLPGGWRMAISGLSGFS
jgi:hypothetical protein